MLCPRLAQAGYNLILADRREAELHDFCQSVTSETGVTVEPLIVDLTDPSAVDRLAQRLAKRTCIEYLINNAGFAQLRQFVEIDANQHLQMVALHVAAPTRLIHAVLPGMMARQRGNIINVSLFGAWLPAGDAQYAATKSYLLALSQSLHHAP